MPIKNAYHVASKDANQFFHIVVLGDGVVLECNDYYSVTLTPLVARALGEKLIRAAEDVHRQHFTSTDESSR